MWQLFWISSCRLKQRFRFTCFAKKLPIVWFLANYFPAINNSWSATNNIINGGGGAGGIHSSIHELETLSSAKYLFCNAFIENSIINKICVALFPVSIAGVVFVVFLCTFRFKCFRRLAEMQIEIAMPWTWKKYGCHVDCQKQ